MLKKKYHPSKVKSVLYQNTDNHLGELWQYYSRFKFYLVFIIIGS